MEDFSHLGGGSNSRSSPFMYLPSSSTQQQQQQHQPTPSSFYNPNTNPTSSHPKSETVGSFQNPYARKQSIVSSNISQESIKAKIISHPQYSTLLGAYMDCQKVGAPPEVAARLAAIAGEIEARQQATVGCRRDATSADPELDQFMEAYCNMLVKYREELMRPLHDAMDFLKRVESQLNSLTNGATRTSIFSSEHPYDIRKAGTLAGKSVSLEVVAISKLPTRKSSEGKFIICQLVATRGLLVPQKSKPGTSMSTVIASIECEGVGSSEEDQDGSGGEGEHPEINPRAEDKELKHHLLKKYSGYLSSLRHELSKKKKKGKLPKEARQKLLSWWEMHYKWPYPSESEKVALAESTGLDQKQINNWFINQRKRHWKPSEDMQIVVMDAFHPQNAAALYMGGQFMGDGSYRLGP